MKRSSPEILNLLLQAFRLDQEQRFGQLITNIFGVGDLFYLTDEEAIKIIKEWIKNDPKT